MDGEKEEARLEVGVDSPCVCRVISHVLTGDAGQWGAFGRVLMLMTETAGMEMKMSAGGMKWLKLGLDRAEGESFFEVLRK